MVMLVELAGLLKPRLNIMDADIAMEGNGHGSGDSLTLGVVMAGQDPVAVDVVCGEVVGVASDVLPLVKAASAAGFGESRLQDIRIRGESLSEIQVKNFRLPPREHPEWRMPEWARRMLKDALTTRPVIDDHACIRCGICQSHCPQKAIADIDNKLVINYRNCIRCFCCQEFCPSGAIAVVKGGCSTSPDHSLNSGTGPGIWGPMLDYPVFPALCPVRQPLLVGLSRHHMHSFQFRCPRSRFHR